MQRGVLVHYLGRNKLQLAVSSMLKIRNIFLSINFGGWILILIGTFTWSLTMFKSGLIYYYGMGFWGPNGHDGVWHIALIKSLARGSLEIPVFAGSNLQNYHIGFDLFVALLHRISFIPIETLYFQITPTVFALLIGVFAYLFVYEWKKSATQAWWSCLFIYFGGSWGWIINMIRGNGLGGESMFWSQQSISTLINPPFAMSLVILFAGLWLLLKGLKTESKSKRLYFITSILFGLLIEIKVYAGILALCGLFISGLWQFFKNRKISLLKVFTGALIVSLLVFLPLFNPDKRTLVFQPFWFLDTMMAISDRLYWPKFAEALLNYRLGGNYLKLSIGYIVAFIIFWYGNLGTRALKEIQVWKWLKKWKENTWIEVFIAVVVIGGLIMPMLFLQEGTPWNTIQFLYYSLMFSGILGGIVFGERMEKMPSAKWQMTSSLLLILLTLPTTLGTLTQYLPSRPPAKVSIEEIQALHFLEQQPDGVVLVFPYDAAKAKEAENTPPRPLYLYESTAYVSAFSNKSTFLEDEVNLNITGYDWKMRRNEVESFYSSIDQNFTYNFLRQNHIAYIYWLKGQRATLGESQLGIEKIFENSEVSIYKVK